MMHRFKGALGRNDYAVVWSNTYKQFIRVGLDGRFLDDEIWWAEWI